MRNFIRFQLALALLAAGLAALAFACSEAVGSKPDSGGGGDAAMGPDATGGNDATPPNDSGGTTPDAGACGFDVDGSSLAVVVNEIRPKGTEFVELYNPTSNDIDLSTFKVADSVSDSGCPKTSEALVFPTGASIPPGGYVVIFTSSGDAGGPFTDCHDAGVATCWQATWGISNSNGETVYVLDSNDVITTSAYYPALAVDSGLSWGRLPNGTGDFAVNTPTPGAANQP